MTNASAGSAERSAVSAAVSVLRGGADVSEVECSDPAELGAIVAGREGRTLVVAGGDGSVHSLAQALYDATVLAVADPIGLLPLGTGNDLARCLGLPLDPEAAAEVVLRGAARTLDLIVDDAGGVVVNAVHVGVGAEAARRGEVLKDRLGAAAYAAGSVAAGVAESGWRLRVVADGAVLATGEEPVLMVAVANGTSIGGGALLAPDALPDDGFADVVVSASTGPLARLGFAVGLRSGEHVERDDVAATRARVVTVSGDPVPVNADGELSGPIETRTWTVHPGAWSLLAPPRPAR